MYICVCMLVSSVALVKCVRDQGNKGESPTCSWVQHSEEPQTSDDVHEKTRLEELKKKNCQVDQPLHKKQQLKDKGCTKRRGHEKKKRITRRGRDQIKKKEQEKSKRKKGSLKRQLSRNTTIEARSPPFQIKCQQQRDSMSYFADANIIEQKKKTVRKKAHSFSVFLFFFLIIISTE